MRKYLFTLAAALYAATAVVAQQPQAEPKERTITVIGTGSVKYKPEGAKISFGVRAADNTFGTAWKDNQVQAEKLRTALEGLKFDGIQVKVSAPDVMHNENLANGVAAPMVGVPGGFNDKAYNITRSFQVVVAEKDFAQLHKQVLKVIETAMTHGANCSSNAANRENLLMGGFGNGMQGNSITRVEFFSSDDRTHRSKAYQQAVEAAMSNARGAAKGANLSAGPIFAITDHQQQEMNYNFGILQNESPQQDVSGEVDLTVRVKLTVKF